MPTVDARCEFCGKPLEPLTVSIPSLHGEPVMVGYRECGCEGAVRSRMESRKADAEKAEAERRDAAHRKAGIPPKYLDAEADISKALPLVMNGKGVYAFGGNGTGKTTFACALAKAVSDLGKPVVFTSSSRMKGELFSTTRAFTEEDLFRKWTKPWLLVIDDLGKECGTKTVVSMLYRIVNERDEQMRPVVVTSNFSKAEIGEKLAESGDVSCAKAIVSRLCGMTETFEFAGEDRRLA